MIQQIDEGLPIDLLQSIYKLLPFRKRVILWPSHCLAMFTIRRSIKRTNRQGKLLAEIIKAKSETGLKPAMTKYQAAELVGAIIEKRLVVNGGFTIGDVADDIICGLRMNGVLNIRADA